MKSFKTLLSEVAQPSERGAEEEQAFKDQHSYKVHAHPVALPHQHTGEIAKPKASRKADQEGSANYDTAYAYGMNAMMSKAMGEETDLVENPAEEIPMMKSQLDFICTAATTISEALGNNDPEEWYQNKLATAHEAMKTLHANIVGKNENTAASNAKALDNATASTAAGKKKVTLAKAPWDKGKDESLDYNPAKGEYNQPKGKEVGKRVGTREELSGGQKKLDHNKNGKIDGHDFAVMRARKKNEEVVAETTNSALITAKESVEQFDEAYKAGIVKFKDGKQAIIKKQDADLLNKMLKDLSPASRRSMSKVAETDEAGFDEILGFAREAL